MLGNRVKAAGIERMTTQQTTCGEISAFEEPKAFNRLHGVA